MVDRFERIIVVDDDEDSRQNLCEALSMDSYIVESADSAEKALEKIKICAPQ